MPVTVEAVKPDVFVLKWHGHITVQEVYESHTQTTERIQAAGVQRYIHIIDMAETVSFPPNLAAAIKVLRDHPQVFAVLLVDVLPAASVLVKVLNSMLPDVTLKVMCSLEEALAYADVLLEAEVI